MKAGDQKMYDNFFSERLADLRMKKGVSARDMSLSIGQSENYINKIELKKAFPSMTVFFYICEYLGISPKDFFDAEDEYPGQIAELIQNLKQLDEQSLVHISAIVKGLIGKNN